MILTADAKLNRLGKSRSELELRDIYLYPDYQNPLGFGLGDQRLLVGGPGPAVLSYCSV
jgi:hypothetical protein